MSDNCSRFLSALFILADRLYKNEIKKNQVNNSPILSPKSTRLQSRSATNRPFQTSNQTIF